MTTLSFSHRDGKNRIPMPPKWTDDKEEMGYDYPGAGNDSDGQLVAKDYGLKDPKPIMSNSNKLGKIPIPPRWTDDKEEMGYDYLWADDDSEGQLMAKDFGLKDPKPIMSNSNESGGCLRMFKSGTKFYIWNPIEGGIWEIVNPTGLDEIMDRITRIGVKDLKVEPVEAVD